MANFTMNEKILRRNQTLLWSAVGLSILFVLYILSPVLTPFMMALAFAYILSPGVRYLERILIPRWLAVFIMVTLLIAIFLGILLVVIPLTRRELNLVIEQLPNWIALYNLNWAPRIDRWLGVDSQLDTAHIRSMIQDALTGTDSLFNTFVSYLQSSAPTLIFMVVSALLVPVLLIYLLLDWEKFITSFRELIPRRFLIPTVRLLQDIDALLASFLRGQISVMLILAFYYSMGLTIAGFDSAIPIGVLTGMLVFIPYLGFMLGLLLAIFSSLLQFDGYYGLIAVGIVFGFGQVLEGMFLTPKIMGNRIGLHPLFIILAIFAFGKIFGFFGVLLAIPMSAALSVVIRRIYAKYRSSSFYTHD